MSQENHQSHQYIPWSPRLESYASSILSANVDESLTPALKSHIVARCLLIFHLIHEKTGGLLGQQCYIPITRLRKIYHRYRDCIRLLYNCNLIFYNEGRHGCISHGLSKSTRKQFCGCYQLSSRLLSSPTEFSYSIRSKRSTRCLGCYRRTPPPDVRLLNLVKNRDYITTTLGVKIPSVSSLSRRGLNTLVRLILSKQESLSHGEEINLPQYTELTFDDGTPFKCGLPRHGIYSHGRIYSALSCLPKSKRQHLLYHGRPLVELGDIHSCFIRIVASLSHDPSLIKEVTTSDIYSDCIKDMSLSVSRDTIKPYFQKYLLSTHRDLLHSMRHRTPKNSPLLMSAVFHYMESRFPIAHQYVISSPLVKRHTLTRNLELKSKSVKSLISRLQETESSLIQHVSQSCRGTLWTVHDSILSDTPQELSLQSRVDSLLFSQTIQNTLMPDSSQKDKKSELSRENHERSEIPRSPRRTRDFLEVLSV